MKMVEASSLERSSLKSVNYPSRAVTGTENYQKAKFPHEPETGSFDSTPDGVSDPDSDVKRGAANDEAESLLRVAVSPEADSLKKINSKDAIELVARKCSDLNLRSLKNKILGVPSPVGLEYSSCPVPLLLDPDAPSGEDSRSSQGPKTKGSGIEEETSLVTAGAPPPNSNDSSDSSYNVLPSRPCRPVASSSDNIQFCNCSLRSSSSGGGRGSSYSTDCTITSSLLPEASSSTISSPTSTWDPKNRPLPASPSLGDPPYCHYRVPTPVPNPPTSPPPTSTEGVSEDKRGPDRVEDEAAHVYENPIDLDCEFCCNETKGQT